MGRGGYGLPVVFQDPSVGSWGGLELAPCSETAFPYEMTPRRERTGPRTVHTRTPDLGSPKLMQCGACFLPERKSPLVRTLCFLFPQSIF